MTIWTVPAVVTRVIDADTYVADLDLGWRVWMRDTSIRLAGLNSPELATEAGKAARAYAVDRLLTSLGPGTLRALPVPVTVHSHKLDKYGRVLGVIYLSPGMSINDDLIAAGYAVVMK